VGYQVRLSRPRAIPSLALAPCIWPGGRGCLFFRHSGRMLESSARAGEFATRAAGARVLAIEPIPGTFAWLTRNIAVNGLGERVRALNLGLGRREGRLPFAGGAAWVR